MKERSLFGPLVLIAIGVVWLLVSLRFIPAANLWALAHIWPYVLIVLGVGLILRSYVPMMGQIVSLLIVAGAILAIVYAPRLGWAGGPDWNLDSDIGGGVSGSRKVEAETRNVKDFDAVSIRYPAEIVIQQGESESLKVEADDNFLPQLSTDVRDGTLYIENNEGNWSKRVNPSKPVKITITVKDLKEIDFSSAGTLKVNGLQADDLSLRLSGAGEITLDQVKIKNLQSRLSGAGNIKANGAADTIDVTISGFGNFDAQNLESLTANVRISGAGNATVRVKTNLNATVSGAGSINYYGSPQVTQHISGAGSIKKVGD